MRFIRTLALVLAFGAATSCATTQQADIGPNPPNVLDAYVARPDPTFAWKVEKTFTGEGYHGAVLELTSQTWMTAADSDRSVWKHWLTITVRLASVARASITIEQQAWRGDELLSEGSIRIACVEAGTFQPRRIPTEIASRLPTTKTPTPIPQK